MKLSTKGRYGSRFMLDLAINAGKGPILLKDIARRQEISEGYLEHLIRPLKAAGLVNSTRGVHGGYMLAKDTAQITLGDVVRAIEGNMDIVECVATPESCHRTTFCVTRDVWNKISSMIKDLLNSYTLQDMVHMYQHKRESHPLMYSI